MTYVQDVARTYDPHPSDPRREGCWWAPFLRALEAQGRTIGVRPDLTPWQRLGAWLRG